MIYTDLGSGGSGASSLRKQGSGSSTRSVTKSPSSGKTQAKGWSSSSSPAWNSSPAKPKVQKLCWKLAVTQMQRATLRRLGNVKWKRCISFLSYRWSSTVFGMTHVVQIQRHKQHFSSLQEFQHNDNSNSFKTPKGTGRGNSRPTSAASKIPSSRSDVPGKGASGKKLALTTDSSKPGAPASRLRKPGSGFSLLSCHCLACRLVYLYMLAIF